MEDHILTLTPNQRANLEKLGVALCYLHGSVAHDTARQGSDIDIAVLFEKRPLDPIQATADILQALHGFGGGREIDVAILNDASPLLKHAVASQGIVLFAHAPDVALRFQLRTSREYEYSRRVVHLGQELAQSRTLP